MSRATSPVVSDHAQPSERLLTPQQLAARWQVHVDWLSSHILAMPDGVPVVVIGRGQKRPRKRIRLVDVLAFEESRLMTYGSKR